jgi:hypothetical protein
MEVGPVLMTTMAVRVFEHGGPETLVYDDYALKGPDRQYHCWWGSGSRPNCCRP